MSTIIKLDKNLKYLSFCEKKLLFYNSIYIKL